MTTTFPKGKPGGVYATTHVQRYGGRPPYNWTVTAGALPTGLILDANGRVSGTVDAGVVPGNFPFTVALTDGLGRTSSKAFSITIDQPVRLWVGGTSYLHEWDPITNTHLHDYPINNNPQSNVVCSGEHILCNAGANGYDHRTSRLLLDGTVVWGPTVLEGNTMGFPYYDGYYYNCDTTVHGVRKRRPSDGGIVATCYPGGFLVSNICADGVGNVWAMRSNGNVIHKIRCSDMTLLASYVTPNWSWDTAYQSMCSDGSTYMYVVLVHGGTWTSYYVHCYRISDGACVSWNFTNAPYSNHVPRAACLDGAGNIWVRGYNNVDKISLADGTRLGRVALSGNGDGGICYDGNGYVWTPDTGFVLRKIRCSDATSVGTYGDWNTTHGAVGIATSPNILPALL